MQLIYYLYNLHVQPKQSLETKSTVFFYLLLRLALENSKQAGKSSSSAFVQKMADFGWGGSFPGGIKAFDTMQGPLGLLGTRPLCPPFL